MAAKKARRWADKEEVKMRNVTKRQNQQKATRARKGGRFERGSFRWTKGSLHYWDIGSYTKVKGAAEWL